MHLTISSVDVIVIFVYLAGVVALGLWSGRGNQDLDDFMLGGRDLPWWALLGSIVATETSTATFLSVPGLAFAKGGDFRFLQLAFGYIVGRGLVVLLLLPAYFRGHMLTAYEVLQERFGTTTRQLASCLFLFARNLGDGLRLYLTAIAVKLAIGLPMTWCIVVVGVVTVVYTLFGGMRSIVWNDCVQLVVYMAAGIVTLWILIDRLPEGTAQIWSFAETHEKLRIFDFRLDFAENYTFWAGLIGGACLTLGTHGTDQMIVQRCLAARSQSEAGRALFTSGVVVLFQFALFLAIGVGLACFFDQFPSSHPIEKGDEAYAVFIVHHMPRGLVGLTLAGLVAAAMSTLSSSLNSSAAAIVGDFGSLFGFKEWPPSRQLTVSRSLTVGFAAVQIAIAIEAQQWSANVVSDALAIAGFTAGLLLGIFFLGVLTTRVTQSGAIVGLLAGLTVLLYVKFGTGIAWPWYPVIGSTVTFLAGWIVGQLVYLFRPTPKPAE